MAQQENTKASAGENPALAAALAEQHLDLLRASAISDEVALERGYFTATKRTQLADLGFKGYQRIVPALVVPIRNSRGEIVTYQTRPDQPRIGEDGRPIKYETPAKTPPALDVPAGARQGLGSIHAPLWITEGARKADAGVSAGLCCISVPGVWSWAKRLNADARQVLPDLQRIKFEERKVILAFDSDVMSKPQVYAALEALAAYISSRGALVSFLYLSEDEPGEKCGLDDFLAVYPVEKLWDHVEDELRTPPKPKPKTPALPAAKLLAMVENVLRRYVRFPDEHGPTALALYTLHTHALAAAHATPYIYVKSPQKRSGKTRVLETLELPARTPIRSASISAAAIYQAVEHWRPTLLIDEVDAIFAARSEKAEELRGIINSGNRRGSVAIRGTQDGEPVMFETFCPKVLAGIDTGKLPDTIRDRSIVVGLERKLRTEQVARLRNREIADEVEELQKRLADWAAENEEALRDYEAEPLLEIDDRLDEAWEPLFAIADNAGCGWPERARAAAVALAAGAEDTGEDHTALLLEALRTIVLADAMLTKDICKVLNENEDLPFGAYRKENGIDGRRLSRMLKPYGIKPGNVRPPEGGQGKGYRREQFAEVWDRYTSATTEAGASASQPSQRPSHPENGSAMPIADGTDPQLEPTPDPSQPPPVEPGTDSRNGEVTDPYQPQTASESQESDPWDGGTDGTAEEQAPARHTFSMDDPDTWFPGMRPAPSVRETTAP